MSSLDLKARARKEHVCEKCGYKTYQKTHYNNHLKRKKPCTVNVTEPKEPAQNMSEHVTKQSVSSQQHVCHMCNTSFDKNHSLSIHQAHCTGTHPLECEKCGKRFMSRQGKHIHKKRESCNPIMILEKMNRDTF